MVRKLEQILKKQIRDIKRPYGIFLSGGIDSGILAALSKPNFAITCNFPLGEKYDELEYAQMIAKHLGIPLTVVNPNKETFEKQLRVAVNVIGQPTNSVSIVPWFNLMGEVKGKTMINGEGADELFGGYTRYIILKQIYDMYNSPHLNNYIPTLDFLFKGIHSKLIEKEMPEIRDIEKAMRWEYDNALPDTLFMEVKLAEYFNIDFHQPFMSPEVRDFAWSLPLDKKIRGQTTKIILRKLARKYLPREIMDRKDKKGLVCPVNKWMGWTGARGEFDKVKYMEFQKKCLK